MPSKKMFQKKKQWTWMKPSRLEVHMLDFKILIYSLLPNCQHFRLCSFISTLLDVVSKNKQTTTSFCRVISTFTGMRFDEHLMNTNLLSRKQHKKTFDLQQNVGIFLYLVHLAHQVILKEPRLRQAWPSLWPTVPPSGPRWKHTAFGSNATDSRAGEQKKNKNKEVFECRERWQKRFHWGQRLIQSVRAQ